MPSTVEVTASVLGWALEEDGLSEAAFADCIGVPPALVEQWTSGDTQPNMAHD